jgi:hypothetical protein
MSRGQGEANREVAIREVTQSSQSQNSIPFRINLALGLKSSIRGQFKIQTERL